MITNIYSKSIIFGADTQNRMSSHLPHMITGTFPYAAGELSAFAYAFGVFIISKKDRSIVRYSTPDPETFYKWLTENKVRDIDGGKRRDW